MTELKRYTKEEAQKIISKHADMISDIEDLSEDYNNGTLTFETKMDWLWAKQKLNVQIVTIYVNLDEITHILFIQIILT